MAAAPQIPAKAMGMIDYINERMTVIVPQLDDIHNLMQSNDPDWERIEEKITDTELEILYASEEINALQKLANKEGFPGDIRASIDAQAGQLSEIFDLIASIKGHASYAPRDEEARAEMKRQLDTLLLQARGTQILVASFHQQVGQHGGSRKRSLRSKRTKRSKRSKRTKRKQRTHRKI